MALNRSKIGSPVHNISKPKPINAADAKNIANREITLRQFNPDYDMIIKRISTAPNALRCGAVPGIVT